MGLRQYQVLVGRGDVCPGDVYTEHEVCEGLLQGEILPGVVFRDERSGCYLAYRDNGHGVVLIDAQPYQPQQQERLAGKPGEIVYLVADAPRKFGPGRSGLVQV
ncbi:MAG: hypothetical protein GX601_07975 [Anaerolineales bacterium]|nr:hypothetical protein [Anaerolineales bacterium]